VSWDAFQREALAELGHVLYRQASAALADADSGMLARLARAAGVEAEALHAQADIAALSLRLHGDAAAKRALWPRLRALRRLQ
jgi:hypothetical protein